MVPLVALLPVEPYGRRTTVDVLLVGVCCPLVATVLRPAVFVETPVLIPEAVARLALNALALAILLFSIVRRGP